MTRIAGRSEADQDHCISGTKKRQAHGGEASLNARQQRTVSTRYGKQFLKKGFFIVFRGALMHVADDKARVNIEDDKAEQDEPGDLLLVGAIVVDGICWAALKDPTQLHC